jgi:hypothetical protein
VVAYDQNNLFLRYLFSLQKALPPALDGDQPQRYAAKTLT